MFLVSFSFFGSPKRTVMFFGGSKASKNLMFLISCSFFGSQQKNSDVFWRVQGKQKSKFFGQLFIFCRSPRIRYNFLDVPGRTEI